MNPHIPREGRRRRTLAWLLGVVGATLAIGVAGGCGDNENSATAAGSPYSTQRSETTRHSASASPKLHSESAHAFQDEMRRLWEDHVTWTRLAIISFVDDLKDLEPTVARLMQNQTDIGDAIEPYYGKRAGDKLTGLLKDHINGAVELLGAAKAGDAKQLEEASTAWYRNGNQIADFLSQANRDNWPPEDLRSMMKAHLDQTLEEATHRLKGDHQAEVRSYDEIHLHILKMADALSDGIAAQFPERFA